MGGGDREGFISAKETNNLQLVSFLTEVHNGLIDDGGAYDDACMPNRAPRHGTLYPGIIILGLRQVKCLEAGISSAPISPFGEA